MRPPPSPNHRRHHRSRTRCFEPPRAALLYLPGAPAAIRGELTADSTREQDGAGLGRCSPSELARITDLNRRYSAKFGFPSILAVKGHDRDGMLRDSRAAWGGIVRRNSRKRCGRWLELRASAWKRSSGAERDRPQTYTVQPH